MQRSNICNRFSLIIYPLNYQVFQIFFQKRKDEKYRRIKELQRKHHFSPFFSSPIISYSKKKIFFQKTKNEKYHQKNCKENNIIFLHFSLYRLSATPKKKKEWKARRDRKISSNNCKQRKITSSFSLFLPSIIKYSRYFSKKGRTKNIEE